MLGSRPSMTYFKMIENPYLRLMRIHQPVGIWLLMWPCWWAVALASEGLPSPYLLALFAIGAVLMRSAGCIVNDIADREFDKHVERTKHRPLASGELSLMQALMLLAVLLLCSLAIAMLLGKMVVMWALLSLPLIVTYPLMKRISWWPQLFLGFTFNWGALMGWAAVRGGVDMPAILLYAGGIFWTLGYDTIYAHQDKKDDTRVGIKSTALKLGENTKPVVGAFYIAAIALWMAAGVTAGRGIFTVVLLLGALAHFLWQVKAVKLNEPACCRLMFMSNTTLGWLIFAAFIA